MVNIDIFCTGPCGTSGVDSQYNVSIGFFCSFVCSLSLIANFYKTENIVEDLSVIIKAVYNFIVIKVRFN
jgi:hypothetical protein